MQKVVILVLTAVAFLSGCAQQWTKPGLSQDEFQRDRYTCLQGSQQSQSSFVIGQFTAGGASGMQTNDMLFRACMSSKGYSIQTVDTSGKVINQSPVMVRSAQAQTDMQALVQTTCTNPEYAAYFEMTPCLVKDIQFQHLANETKITPTQKEVFIKARAALDALNRQQLDNLRQYGGDSGRSNASKIERVQPLNDQNNLDLYNGQITWGTYSKRRREIVAQMSTS